MCDLVKHLSDRERPSDPTLVKIRQHAENPVYIEVEAARRELRQADIKCGDAEQEAACARADKWMAEQRLERALANAKLFESMEG
ncbi:MAG: hypothetical protein AAGF20_00245 [Pseudomonadota bacterium]